jgi:hypothetical protein
MALALAQMAQHWLLSLLLALTVWRSVEGYRQEYQAEIQNISAVALCGSYSVTPKPKS